MYTKLFTIACSLGLLLGLFSPAVSFAATSSSITTQSLLEQLSQLSAELSSGASGSTTITLSPGDVTTQASSTAAGGLLQISLPTFATLEPDPYVPVEDQKPAVNFAEVSLQYLPCVAAAPSVCVAMASTSYPKMTADLSLGETTGYLHYLITLTNLSTTTATLHVTDSTYFSDIQNQVNAIAARMTNLIGQ